MTADKVGSCLLVSTDEVGRPLRLCRLRESFWNLYVKGCDEHYLAHILRDHSDFIPEMNYVAVYDERIVGNIMYTKSYVIDDKGNKADTLTFGPLCVLPEFQRKGIGTLLINRTKEIALQKGAGAIIILGHPRNYCRHGFKNCKDYNVSDTEGRYPFGQLVLELKKDFFAGRKWKFHYSSAYHVDENLVRVFDEQFPLKEKLYRPTQEEFSIACRAYLE